MTTETIQLNDNDRTRLVRQLHAHQPIAGYCPACGVKRCNPRRDAQERLLAAGVDLSRPSPLGDGIIQIYRDQYRGHRNDPDVCREHGVADCAFALAAWQGLMASGLDPAKVAP